MIANLCEECLHKPICKYKNNFANSLIEINTNKNIDDGLLKVACRYWINEKTTMYAVPPPKK